MKFICSPKYDGMAAILYYKKGKLIRAVTRGDGVTGEDVTRNILKARNVKKIIKDKTVTEIIGEVVLPLDTFDKKLKNIYSNPRNGCVGALKDFKGKNAKYLQVRYYGCNTTDKKLTEFKQFGILEELGFKHLEFSLVEGYEGVKQCYKDFKKIRNKKNYLADGMVVTINSGKKQRSLGRSPSGNPKYSVALKFPPPVKTTTVKDIEWSTGKTGTLTPVAVVKKIDLGVNVTRVSLANLDLMKELKISIGDKVVVSRRGDVIPYIEKNLTKKKNWTLSTPPKCPSCESATVIDGPFLTCSNNDCESRKLGDLYKWSDKIKNHFKVKGLGPERIEQMYRANLVKAPADLYTLKPSSLIGTIDGVKERAARNILAFQEHIVVPLDLFLGGLNIPSIGQSIFGFLIDAGFDTLDKIYKVNSLELAGIANIGELRAKVIINWLKVKRPTVDALLKHVTIAEPEEVELASSSLESKSFCFTGKLSQSRGHYEDIVKANGGEIKSVSKNLSYLVVGDKAGSKLAKAEKAGVEVLNEKQFMEMV